jgi:hypothetical protein
MKNITAKVNTLLIKFIGGIVGTASRETRINFSLALIADEVRSQSGLENWKLFNRIYGRFLKSYPMQPSIESLRTYGFYKLIGGLKNVPGDIIECGVGRARYLVVFEYANQFFGLGRTVYGFDTFEGFPAAHKKDIGLRVADEGSILGWESSSADLARFVIETDSRSRESVIKDVQAVSVVTVPGLFKDTLPANLPEKIAFLHADADLYESTRDILVEALPRMSSGGWIVFDELHETEKWPGVKKAVDEFCVPKKLFPQWIPELNRFGIQIP